MCVSAVVADVRIADNRPCPYYHTYAEQQKWETLMNQLQNEILHSTLLLMAQVGGIV